MSEEKVFGQSRKWLNPVKSDDTGAISWSVSVSKWNNNWADVSISIWDCGRKIDLELGFGKEKKSVNARATKINLLINELTKMRDAMSDAYLYILEEQVENESNSVPYIIEGEEDE